MSKPPSIFVKENAVDDLSEEQTLKNLIEKLPNFLVEKSIKHVVIQGFESSLVCLNNTQLAKHVVLFSKLLTVLKSKVNSRFLRGELIDF